MDTLNFKAWIAEDIAMPTNPLQKPNMNDPLVKGADLRVKQAMQSALKSGKDPLKAAQAAAINSGVPTNKMGDIMPTKPGQQ